MAVVKISDLPVINRPLNRDEDFVVINDSSAASGSRSVKAPIQKLIDVSPIKLLSSEKIVMTEDLLLSIDGPEFISLDPNGQNRSVTLPNPNPSQVKFLFIFSENPANSITLRNFSDSSAIVVLGGDSQVSYVQAYSIANDWFVTQGIN